MGCTLSTTNGRSEILRNISKYERGRIDYSKMKRVLTENSDYVTHEDIRRVAEAAGVRKLAMLRITSDIVKWYINGISPSGRKISEDQLRNALITARKEGVTANELCAVLGADGRELKSCIDRILENENSTRGAQQQTWQQRIEGRQRERVVNNLAGIERY